MRNDLSNRIRVCDSGGFDHQGIQGIVPVCRHYALLERCQKLSGFALTKKTASDNGFGGDPGICQGGFIQTGFGKFVHQKHETPFWMLIRVVPQERGLTASEKASDQDDGQLHFEEAADSRVWTRSSREGMIEAYCSLPSIQMLGMAVTPSFAM